MNPFEELEDCYVKVCRDKNRPPIQWIYSVDDAWFHPASFNVTDYNSKQSEGTKKLNKPIWQQQCGEMLETANATNLLTSATTQNVRTVNNGRAKPSAAGPQQPGAGLSTAEKIDDAAVADQLIQFATLQNDYGLCFCSFEYLWKHFQTSINAPQNAILFDLNHQLAGIITDLKKDWVKNIAGFNLYEDSTAQDATLCGWLLHFAIKFGKLGDQRSLISPNHLLLVSSAIAAKGGPSADAMTQYLQVQLSMWSKLSKDNDFLETGRMVDFSFAPLPKVVGSADANANLLDTGLKIFNNTFKNAANWAIIRKLLLSDMLFLWSVPNGGGQPDNGHSPDTFLSDGTIEQEKLRCHGWIEDAGGSRLRGIHYCPDARNLNSEKWVAAKSLINYLKMSLTDSSSVALHNEFSDWHLFLPTNPGLSYLIGIIDFIKCLEVTEGHEGHVLPTVSLERLELPDAIGLVVKISASGVRALKAAAENTDLLGDPRKASGAIQRVINGSRVLMHHMSPHDLEQPFENGTTRKCHLENNCCSKLATVHFDSDAGVIRFKFFKKNP